MNGVNAKRVGKGWKEERMGKRLLHTSISALYRLSRARDPSAATSLTHHNIAYMISFVRDLKLEESG